MTVTSFALAILASLAGLLLTIWAIAAWGAVVVLPILGVLALGAVWAFSPIGYDDGHTG